MNAKVSIREGSVSEVVKLSLQIPEFDNPYKEETYLRRMNDRDSLILVAEVNGTPVGFKVGYDKFEDGSFYSWMGGVLPSCRQVGVAKKLAKRQEGYAKKNSYSSILMKTRNRHTKMLLFALTSGFQIIQVSPRGTVSENRVLLKKDL